MVMASGGSSKPRRENASWNDHGNAGETSELPLLEITRVFLIAVTEERAHDPVDPFKKILECHSSGKRK